MTRFRNRAKIVEFRKYRGLIRFKQLRLDFNCLTFHDCFWGAFLRSEMSLKVKIFNYHWASSKEEVSMQKL